MLGTFRTILDTRALDRMTHTGSSLLPNATHVASVDLQVGDLERSIAFYEQALGFQVRSREGATVALAAQGNGPILVTLHERPGAASVPTRGRLGLFHFAILLPDRPSLARFVMHAIEQQLSLGAGDHLVSEAFYLSDPDGLGIEVYADRPRDEWRRTAAGVEMATLPVDLPSLLADAGDERWNGMPAGTVIGHVHLHVGDLPGAMQFYGAELGLEATAEIPGAAFLAAGGYHHHLGVNTWARGAQPAQSGEARLLEWTLRVPADGVAAVRERLVRAGRTVTGSDDGFTVPDPWGTVLRLRPAAPQPATPR